MRAWNNWYRNYRSPNQGLHEFNLDFLLDKYTLFNDILVEFHDILIPEQVHEEITEQLPGVFYDALPTITPRLIDEYVDPAARKAARDELADVEVIAGIQRNYVTITADNISTYMKPREDGLYYIADITSTYGNEFLMWLLSTSALPLIGDLPTGIVTSLARFNLQIYAPSPARNYWLYTLNGVDCDFSGTYQVNINKVSWHGTSGATMSTNGGYNNQITKLSDFTGSLFDNYFTHSIDNLAVITNGVTTDEYKKYIPEKAYGRINTLWSRNRRNISSYENGSVLQIFNDQSIWWGLYGVNNYDSFKYMGLHDEIYAAVQGVNPAANEINFCNNTSFNFDEDSCGFNPNTTRLSTPRIITATKSFTIEAKPGYEVNIVLWNSKSAGIVRSNLKQLLSWRTTHNINKGDFYSITMRKTDNSAILQHEYANFIITAKNDARDVAAVANDVNPAFPYLSCMKNAAIQYSSERAYFIYLSTRLTTDFIFMVDKDVTLSVDDKYYILKITWNSDSGISRDNLKNVTPWTTSITLKAGEPSSVSIMRRDGADIEVAEYAAIKCNTDVFDDVTIPLNMFQSIGICGDSYAVGSIFINGSNARYPEHTWGKVLERRLSIPTTLYGTGGLTTRSYITNTNGLASVLADTPKEFYILNLGINDAGLGNSYIGSPGDIKSDYTQNNDTFYGNYGRIVAQIKQHAPNAKIMILGNLYGTGNLTQPLKEAEEDIAGIMGVSFIDPYEDGYFTSPLWIDSIESAHPKAYSYAGAATAIERLFGKCVRNYINYYKDWV